jgi:hypothetical protein
MVFPSLTSSDWNLCRAGHYFRMVPVCTWLSVSCLLRDGKSRFGGSAGAVAQAHKDTITDESTLWTPPPEMNRLFIVDIA